MKRTRKKKKKVELFLDSGAFSAESQGSEIDIYEYIKFIQKHEHLIDIYAGLDVIGDSQASMENQQIMEDAGLSPIPTFHYGGDIEKYLVPMIENYEYIALGGMVPISNVQLIQWLDNIFANYITDDQGIPRLKVHGFGLTSLKLMMRYPWYSVDSTSWVITGRMGSIIVPVYRRGEWIYDENSWKISISSRSPGTKNDLNHIDNMPPAKKQIILDYIHEKGYKLGKSSFKKIPHDTPLSDNQRWAESRKEADEDSRLVEIIEEDGVSNRYQLRDELNIIYYIDLEDQMPEWPWSFKPPTNNPKPLF